MERNVAGKFYVYAVGGPDHPTLAGKPITGDLANISVEISKDGGVLAAIGDTTGVEIGKGYYVFDGTATETDAIEILVVGESTTAEVIVYGAPANITTTPKNFSLLNLTAAGKLQTVEVTEGVSGNVTGNVNGSVGSVTGDVGGNVVGTVNDVLSTVGANVTFWQGVPVVWGAGAPAVDAVTLAGSAPNDVSQAEVETAMRTVFSVETHTLPGQEAPPANFSYEQMLAYAVKPMIHPFRQTPTEFQIFNRAGTVVDQKAAASDDTTNTDRGELVSGP